MTTDYAEASSACFEIDQPDEFAPYFLDSAPEVGFYLNLIANRSILLTAHVDDGQRFFLTTIIAVDKANHQFFLDIPSTRENLEASLAARQLTLVANVDRIKMQFRTSAPKLIERDEHKRLVLPIPGNALRLQRREFFRLEPPISTPVRCKLAIQGSSGMVRTHELPLADISGGGLSLIGEMEMQKDFPRDQLFNDCRLDIPGEGVILVNLRVRKAVEMSTRQGEHQLRIGCEFISLPGTRLAMIERYIARIERERKARESGLAD